MKRNTLFIVAMMLSIIASPELLHAKACVQPISIACPSVSCDVNVTYISQADVGSTGYVISTSGRYCLIQDITWTPPATTTLSRSGTATAPIAAITITASNVELNLNGYTLQQSGSANYTVGVFVTNGSATSAVETTSTPLNNVIIRNGTIQNIATAGILVNKVNEFLLEDLYLVRNGGSGYILCPCTAQRTGGLVYVSFVPGQTSPLPYLTNHIWRNVHCDSNSSSFVTSNLFVQGADISGVDGVVLENCTFNNNACGALGNLSGIEMLTNTNVRVSNSQANGNTSTFAGNGTDGFSPALTNFIFENCQANDNIGVTFSSGFNVGSAFTSNILNGIFSNCQANGNTATATPGAVQAFDLFGGYTGITLIDCQANNGSASSDCNGFLFSGYEADFIRCTANNNTCGGAIQTGFTITGAKGFVIVDSDVVNLSDCIANGNTISGATTVGSVAYGISLQACSDCTVTNCTGSESTATVTNGAAAGFHLDGFFITVTNCVAEQNDGTLASNQYEIINLLVANPTNINILNSVAIGDPGQANSVGILLQNALNCIIEGNKIESNVQDGILLTGFSPSNGNNVIANNQIIAPNPFFLPGYSLTGIWAIADNTTATGAAGPTNTYYDNYAWNYPGLTGVANYNPGMRSAGPNDPAYVWQWNIPGGPINYTGAFSKISNVSITT